MNKKGFIFMLCMLVSSVTFADINLVKPTHGETLTIGQNYHIRWTGPAAEGSQTVTVFLEIPSQNWYQIIDQSHTKADEGFIWKVGRLPDSTFVQPGQYTISLESWDGDDIGTPVILKSPISIFKFPEIFKQISEIPVKYDPGVCPVCIRLDLIKLKQKIPFVKPVYILKLYKNKRMVATLGRFGGRAKLPNYAPAKLTKGEMNELRRQGKSTFSLVIFNAGGRRIHSQKVILKAPKRTLLRQKI